jgi:hypothetical protein
LKNLTEIASSAVPVWWVRRPDNTRLLTTQRGSWDHSVTDLVSPQAVILRAGALFAMLAVCDTHRQLAGL